MNKEDLNQKLGGISDEKKKIQILLKEKDE